MEIGIFTFWSSKDNYGQILQSFALQYFLNLQENINAEVIRYYSTKESLLTRLKTSIKQILLRICPIIDRRLALKYNKIQERSFDTFKCKYINYSKSIYYGRNELNKNVQKYDVLIAGSDQVWSMMLDNPQNSVYFLDFGNRKQKRISYAASFGLRTYPKELKEKLKIQLARFSAISVREKDGVSICNDCGCTAIQVFDPTLLLDKEVYLPFILSSRKEPYTFLYILNVSKDDVFWNKIRFCIKTNKILGTTASGYTSDQVILDGVEYENSTIHQWMSNIAYADTVITTSFHGVVFLIIFQKDFIFIPLKGKYAQSNNRVFDLLSKIELENRILFNDSSIECLLQNKIDYSVVEPKLKSFRNKSIEFLKEQLLIK